MPGWNADKWERYKVRDMAKISVLHLLSMIQDEHGDKAVLSAGDIARLSQTRYNSIRKLLHARWNRRDWECKYRDGTVKTKKGMRLVEEVDCTLLQTNFKLGYRLTSIGRTYLEKAVEWHPYWSVAKERVIKARQIAHYEAMRQTSMRFRWYEPVANRFFYIRAPFLQQDFIAQTGKMDGNYRICRSMDSAFAAANQLPNPPSKEFRALVVMGVARAQKESQESARPVADNRPQPPVVNPPAANDADHWKTVST
jgi:hypothetical protein